LALRFDHRRGSFRAPQGVCVLDPVLIQPDLRVRARNRRSELTVARIGLSMQSNCTQNPGNESDLSSTTLVASRTAFR
jgi:hypothetical protein